MRDKKDVFYIIYIFFRKFSNYVNRKIRFVTCDPANPGKMQNCQIAAKLKTQVCCNRNF